MPQVWVWAWLGVMPGAIAIGAAATSISTTAEMPTSTEISIAANTKVETEGVDLNIDQSTAKAFLIVINGRGKNSTGRAPGTRLMRAISFAAAPSKAAAAWVTALEPEAVG